MARKPLNLGQDAEAEIAARASQGWTSESIVKALAAKGIKVSRRTVDARRPRPSAAPTAAELPDLPADAEAIPDGEDPTTYDYWLRVARKQALQAELDKNAPHIARMVGMANDLLEKKRKAMPLPKADPNEHPDMVKLGAETKERVHRAIDLVCG